MKSTRQEQRIQSLSGQQSSFAKIARSRRRIFPGPQREMTHPGKHDGLSVLAAAATAVALFLAASSAVAQFRITTYKAVDNNEIINFDIADAVLTGPRPQRFVD